MMTALPAGEGASHPSNFVHDGKALAFLLGLAVTDAEDTSTDCDESPPEEDDAPPPLLSRLVFQQQKGHVHFNDDDDDNTSSDVLLDEEQVKLLDGFKIMGSDDILGSFLVDPPLGDNQPNVDDCESPGKIFIDVSPGFGEMFDNGLGNTFFNEGSLLRGVIETNKQRKSFLESWSGPSSVLRALPFLWDKRKVGRTHYFADVFTAVQIVAMALGFGSAAAYVRCYIGKEYMNELTKDGVQPSVAYYERAMDLFGCAFGDCMPK
jgi:hypothetical protein